MVVDGMVVLKRAVYFDFEETMGEKPTMKIPQNGWIEQRENAHFLRGGLEKKKCMFYKRDD